MENLIHILSIISLPLPAASFIVWFALRRQVKKLAEEHGEETLEELTPQLNRLHIWLKVAIVITVISLVIDIALFIVRLFSVT